MQVLIIPNHLLHLDFWMTLSVEEKIGEFS